MTTPKNNEPTRQDDNAAAQKKAAPRNLAEFLDGYIGVVDGRDDPNYDNYRVSASKTGEEFADMLVEEYSRQQEEFAKYLREKEQQTE